MANLEPTSATGRMEAARRHRARAYAERNELIAVLARLYESHLMPAAGGLKTLTTRGVVCIHSPAGLLCWVVTAEEADEYFGRMKRVDVNHWDHSTRADRSARLAKLTKLPPAIPGPKKKKKAAVKGRKKR
jgi:hypothetical protein